MRHYPAARDGTRPFDLSMIPTAAEVRAAVKRKISSARDLTTVELAGGGQARVEKPRKYTTAELQTAARIGAKIVISARDVIKSGVAEVLLQALKNGSWVKVIEPKLSAAQQAKLKPIAKELRAAYRRVREFGKAVLVEELVPGDDYRLLVIDGKLFASFVVDYTKSAAIYTSFAIVIIALIWLYVSWLILLVGAQMAFYQQHPRFLGAGDFQAHALDDLARDRKTDAMALE